MAERPTFSPFWHRVRAMTPRLRPHVQITRQHYRGRRWHVVHDPSSNNFYRVNPIAHEFVGLLDGKRTVEQAWEISLTRHGDDAPTQQEAIQLIGQLYQANLLRVDATPEIDQLLQRGRERIKKKAMSQAIGIMYFKIRMFNPDALVTWFEPIFRPILNRFGLLIWLAFCGFAVIRLLPELGTLLSGVDSAIAPNNWPFLIAVFIVTKAIHEMGHGVVLKRHGGQVPEFGIMLLVMFPAPYVDASSAWSLPSKWNRIAVGAGGMLFELFVAAIASLVWLQTLQTPDSLVHQLAYNAMFVASVSTILFNANPLMRFDGYYILSDLIEMPNLMQRSMNQIKHYFKRYLFGMKNDTPPTVHVGERWILTIYGIGAIIYRIFLFFSISLYVMGKMFAIGLLLAIWTAAMWFVMPVGKFINFLAAGQSLGENRPRAIFATLAMVIIGFGLVGALPMPDYRRASGVVESRAWSGVFFAADGFVIDAHVLPGERVEKDQPLVTLENRELQTQREVLSAEISRFEGMRRRAMELEQSAASRPLSRQVAQLKDQLDWVERRLERLVIRAPHAGVFIGPDPHAMVGSFVREGDPIGELVEPGSLRIVASLNQLESSWADDGTPYTVRIRLISAAPTEITGTVEKVIPVGQQRLRHTALSYFGGGGVQTAADDQTGTLAKSKQFVIEIAPDLDGIEWAGLPGERVKLRFELPPKPLLVQWCDWLAKLVQDRINL